MNMLISLIRVIISQCICVLKQVVYLKCIVFIYQLYFIIKLKSKRIIGATLESGITFLCSIWIHEEWIVFVRTEAWNGENWAFWVTNYIHQRVKNLPAIWETWVRYLGWEDPLEKVKATHSSILAWRIPWAL